MITLLKKTDGGGEREMNRKIFSIIAALILILTTFGVFSVSAQECVLISGTVKGKYLDVWCDETEIIPLGGVKVIIEKIGDDGSVVAKTSTMTDCNGYYEQEVLKGSRFSAKTYRITIGSSIQVIYGEKYVFPGQSQTVKVKGSDVTVNFSPIGSISMTKEMYKNNNFILDILNYLIEKFIIKFPNLF